tara:strand:- start:15824 stop:16861 length:1038 start_codon:yes stop_codon:yes gene_type:complete
MDLSSAVYVAILRTREAELKAFRHLGADTRQSLLPVMEFTRSRRGKKNPTGAVDKCVEEVLSMMGDEPFIADVTTLTAHSSSETQELLDPAGGFANWQRFVPRLGANCIPVVHLTDPFDARSLKNQAASLARNSGHVAIRIPPGYADAAALEKALIQALGSMSKVVLICDAAFVDRNSFSQLAMGAFGTLQQFGTRPLHSVVASSCFPPSVVLPNYGGDAYGKFPLLEVLLSEWIKGQAGLEHVLHGDYGLVYPEDANSTATRWVPRVDVPLDTELFYHRYRRPVGGYIKAAQHALHDSDYRLFPCWAHDNIVEAAKGSPMGRSPSHWIAVRVNFHINRQIARLT